LHYYAEATTAEPFQTRHYQSYTFHYFGQLISRADARFSLNAISWPPFDTPFTPFIIIDIIADIAATRPLIITLIITLRYFH